MVCLKTFSTVAPIFDPCRSDTRRNTLDEMLAAQRGVVRFSFLGVAGLRQTNHETNVRNWSECAGLAAGHMTLLWLPAHLLTNTIKAGAPICSAKNANQLGDRLHLLTTL
jgi:hypothetical protein